MEQQQQQQPRLKKTASRPVKPEVMKMFMAMRPNADPELKEWARKQNEAVQKAREQSMDSN
jgi:hypothetical protein